MHQDVQRWLDDVRARHDGTLTLSLRNFRDEGRQDIVDGWELPKDLDAAGLWSKIEEAAQADADLLGGTQRYAVVALVGKDVIGRRLFNLDGRLNSGGPDDPANERGVLAMMMRRHGELDRFVLGLMKGSVGGLVAENRRLQERVERLELRDEERARLYEKTRSKQHERELADRVAEHDMKMKQEVVHGLRMLVPFALSQFTGKPLEPGELAPDEQSLQALLESVRPDQFEKLQGVFTPFQQAALLALWQRYVGGESARKDKQLSAKSASS